MCTLKRCVENVKLRRVHASEAFDALHVVDSYIIILVAQRVRSVHIV